VPILTLNPGPLTSRAAGEAGSGIARTGVKARISFNIMNLQDKIFTEMFAPGHFYDFF
jgi:hypothetical protein